MAVMIIITAPIPQPAAAQKHLCPENASVSHVFQPFGCIIHNFNRMIGVLIFNLRAGKQRPVRMIQHDIAAFFTQFITQTEGNLSGPFGKRHFLSGCDPFHLIRPEEIDMDILVI